MSNQFVQIPNKSSQLAGAKLLKKEITYFMSGKERVIEREK